MNPDIKNLPVMTRSAAAPAPSRNEIGAGLRLTVDKFNAAFPTFSIFHPDREALALMQKYAAIYSRKDIADELEYHLAKPLDEAIGLQFLGTSAEINRKVNMDKAAIQKQTVKETPGAKKTTTVQK